MIQAIRGKYKKKKQKKTQDCKALFYDFSRFLFFHLFDFNFLKPIMCKIRTVPGSVGAGSSAAPGTPWHPSLYRTRRSTPETTGTADKTHKHKITVAFALPTPNSAIKSRFTRNSFTPLLTTTWWRIKMQITNIGEQQLQRRGRLKKERKKKQDVECGIVSFPIKLQCALTKRQKEEK